MSKETDGLGARGHANRGSDRDIDRGANQDRRAQVADHSPRHLKQLLHAMLRGGRITKFKGIVASYAPQQGVVEPIATPGLASPFRLPRLAKAALRLSAAPAALLAFSTPAMANDQCDLTAPGSGDYICIDDGDPAAILQFLQGAAVTVTVEDGFDLDTSSSTNLDGLRIIATQGVVLSQEAGAGPGSITAGASGINASTVGGSSTINTTGIDVSGGYRGISWTQTGVTGSTEIITGNVTGSGTDGIGIYASVDGDGLIIDSSGGTARGGISGITGFSSAVGATGITTADVTGDTGDGIDFISGNTTTSLAIDSSAGTVTGGYRGIYALHLGSEDLDIRVNEVIGQGSEAIRARTSEATANVSIQGGYGLTANDDDITGATDGIYVRTSGADISVDNLDSVTGEDGDGLDLGSGGGVITITDIGTILGTNGNGILADSDGGYISIQSVGGVGGVTAQNGDGIRAYATGGLGGQVNIGGISAIGNVTATGGVGIRALTDGDGSIEIDASGGTINAATAIFADNDGTGDLSITTAAVNADGGVGIIAFHDGTDLSIDSSAGDIDAGQEGIFARNYGTGAMSITTAGVDSESNTAISVLDNGDGYGITIEARGTVFGDDYGINVENYGRDGLSITTADVTGVQYDGIRALNTTAGLTIDTSGTTVSTTVKGGARGIFADQDGAGELSITVNNVTGEGGAAIRALSSLDTAHITVQGVAVQGVSGAITGATDGIFARTDGANITVDNLDSVTSQDGDGLDLASSGGAITVTDIGTINADSGNGIKADSDGGDITIEGVSQIAVSGGYFADGIEADASGGAGGTIDITIGTYTNPGDVSGTINGVVATTDGDGNITIDSRYASVSGDSRGIVVVNRGTGTISITTADVSGSLTSPSANGAIFVLADDDTTGLSLDTSAGTVAGIAYGIRASSTGSGNVSITTADVSATGAFGFGIDAYAGSNVGSLTIDTSAGTGGVTGSYAGIRAIHYGTGNLDITVNDVTGENAQGIRAITTAATANILIAGSSGDITGGTDGIYSRTDVADITVENLDSVTGENGDGLDLASSGGAITVSDIGTILGDYGNGILADSDGGNISIQGVGGVYGVTGTGGSGISADARGGAIGAITIGTTTAIGNVSGTAAGIFAITDGSGGISIDTSAGSVTAGDTGIDASNAGTGALTITTADVTGDGAAGIHAASIGDYGLTIDSSADARIIGGDYGIIAGHSGTGNLEITANYVRGQAAQGIRALTSNAAANIVIQGYSGTRLNDRYIRGETDGVYARATGDGANITVENFEYVRGYNGDGLNLASSGGDITVDNLGYVKNENGVALELASSGGAITVTNIDKIFAAGGRGIRADSDGGNVLIQGVGLVGGVNNGAGDGISVDATGATGGAIIIGGDTYATAIGGIFSVNRGIRAVTDGDGSIEINTAYTVGTRVFGSGVGISATNYGTGAVTITTGNVVSTNNRGIDAYTLGSGLTIDTSEGYVTGQRAGIRARNLGDGVLRITTAAVDSGGGPGSSGYGRAIDALNFGTDLIIDSTGGRVGGSYYGIYALNYNGGAVTITTAEVDSINYDGIHVRNFSGGTGISIDSSAGTVYSRNRDGIDAINNGDGALSITTADVSVGDFGGDGIRAQNFGTDLTIDTRAGAGTVGVSGGDYGIHASNEGTGGAVTITTADVTGTDEAGIIASNNSYGTSLTIDTTVGILTGGPAGIVKGGTAGINATNLGTGDLSITTADVTGDDSVGIAAYAGPNTTALTINSSLGTVTGGARGISARHLGTGDLSITTANVTGESDHGIYAYADSSADALTIDTSLGSVEGDERGIWALHYGDGDLVLTVNNVIGQNGIGIRAETDEPGSNVLIEGSDVLIPGSFGAIQGGTDGINTVTSGGDITVQNLDSVNGDDGDGLDLASSGGDITVTNIGTIEGDLGSGIFADSDGGDISIQDVGGVGGVTAGFKQGIFADARDGADVGGDINIGGDTAIGSVTGEYDGIYARTDGDGSITIDSSSGTVTGDYNGIAAYNLGSGTGFVSITTDDVTGYDSAGIRVTNAGTYISIDSSAGTVIGDLDGISANNTGTGGVSITTANVTGTRLDGIEGTNSNNGTYLSIDTSLGTDTGVTGGEYGIDAANFGTGNLQIKVNDVTGENAQGISAITTQDTANILIQGSSGDIIGGTDGIFARTDEANITVENLDSVTGEDGDGLDLASAGGDITVADIDAINGDAGNGILADSDGGSISIQGVGLLGGITGTGSSGIYADARGGAGGVINIGTITVIGDVSATNDAIAALTDGTGSIAIDSSTATLTSATDEGIDASNRGTGSLTITTAGINAGDAGIFAENSGTYAIVNTVSGTIMAQNDGIAVEHAGTGFLSITTADVTSAMANGIFAYGGATATELAIDSSGGSVSGGTGGIYARNLGSGDLGITVNDVTGYGGAAIDGESTQATAHITVQGSSGIITGSTDGIYLRTAGAYITVENLDSVTGQNGDGLDLGSSGGAITITNIGKITGTGGNGILADSDGGDISIQSVGLVDGVTATATAIGTDGNGILADARGGLGGQINIGVPATAGTPGTIGNVTAYDNVGIRALTDGAGSIMIDASSGTINAGTGVLADNDGTGELSITTAAVNADVGIGIIGLNDNGSNLSIDSSAGNINAALQGIYARNYGTAGTTGTTSITTYNVTAYGGDGVNLKTGAYTTTADIDTSGGAVIGSNRGIYANHAGSGELTITVNNVTGQSAEGILAFTNQTGADITVQGSSGKVVGATSGIVLTTQGADITVTKLDSVTGQAGDGLNLTSNGGNITVTEIGTITGYGGNGIFATSDTGNISIQDIGLVGGITATGGVGIAAYADNGGTISIGTSGDIGTVYGTAFGVNGYSAYGAGDVTIDVSAYSIEGAIGIRAANLGSGATSVTTADVTGKGGEGIDASTAGTNLTVDTTAGTVRGVTSGIIANNTGTGATSIKTGQVEGETANGITAQHSGTDTDLTINSTYGTDAYGNVSSDVTGGVTGIDARNTGNGSISITTIGVTGGTGFGIDASNEVDGNNLTINSSGAVSGATGIRARNLGGGAIEIRTAAVTGDSFQGISALGTGTDLTINSTGGTVSAGTYGIEAQNFGSGELRITTAAIDAGRDGIRVSNNSDPYISSTDLIINTVAGVVDAANSGIVASNGGTGELSITTDIVLATTGDGISANNVGTDLTIDTTAGYVAAGESGIIADQSGSGPTEITTGNVSGTSGAGISVTSASTGGDVTIDSRVTGGVGLVTGGTFGIFVNNSSADGGTFIYADNVEATAVDGDGIYARNAGTDLIIDTSTGILTGVIGGEYGINAANSGDGELSITTRDVTGTSFHGIEAYNSANGTSLTIDTSEGTVTGGARGISAFQRGDGELMITVEDVTGGVGREGISAQTTGSASQHITIEGSSTAEVTGGSDGIWARSTSGANIAISSFNSVTGQAEDGLDLISNGGSITVSDIGTITGTGGNGIYADSDGGEISIQGVGQDYGITGTDGSGIIADASSDPLRPTSGSGAITIGGDTPTTAIGVVNATEIGVFAYTDGVGGISIDTSAGSVTGGNAGVAAGNFGTDGAVTITTAAVDGGSGFGIEARNSGTDIIIDSRLGNVTGGPAGIYARNDGTGLVDITTAYVRGNRGTGYGIEAINSANGGGLKVNTIAGSVSGGFSGIEVQANGTGAVEITTADVEARNMFGIGISAVTGTQSYGLTIDSTASAGTYGVTGGGSGIYAEHFGSGAVEITTADVTGTRSNGVFVESAASATSMTIDTSLGSVTGGYRGVSANHDGTEELKITTAAVTSTNTFGIGIYARNTGTDLTIDTSAGTVDGNYRGIRAVNESDGNVEITTTNVYGSTSDGISVRNTGDGASVSIDTRAGIISGGEDGIDALNNGAETLSILTAKVTGTTGTGIYARNASGATDLIINSSYGDVSGGIAGIKATNSASGYLSITTANVYGGSGEGIFAYTSGTDITIDTTGGRVEGGSYGIQALGQGSGQVRITTADVQSDTRNGIDVRNYGTEVIIDTSEGTVDGGESGIRVLQNADYAVSITVNDVIGRAGQGINAISSLSNADISIQGSSGDIVGATDGIYVRTSGADITVDNLDSVTGQNGDGVDVISAGGDITVSNISTILGTNADGISAQSAGGNIGIDAVGFSGGVEGTYGAGIAANANGGTGGDILIGTTSGIGDVTGLTSGINAITGGSGRIEIDSSLGTVTGNTGIFANTYGSGGISLTVNDVIGRTDAGIRALTEEVTANIAIQGSSGNVTGAIDGIFARTYGADIRVENLDSVTGQSNDGLDLYSNGGAITVTAIDTINGYGGTGIRSVSDGGDISIQAVGLVDGVNAANGPGIRADARGGLGGAINIGGISGIGNVTANATGIDARTDGAGSIIIDTSTGSVNGTGSVIGSGGILANNYGSGAVTITTFDVTGEYFDAISALNYGTDITIDSTAGTVDGNGGGITATNLGSGTLSITAAAVTSTYGNGIFASNSGTDLIIDSLAGDVTGGILGIVAVNNGTGATTVTTAKVTGTASNGIDVRGSGTSLTIDSSAGSVSGGLAGVLARQYGSGSTRVVTADVTGYNGVGIYASNGGLDLTIDSSLGSVTGSITGIAAVNSGTGATSITTADVTGNDGDGISAINFAAAAELIIDTSAGTITGSEQGIYARQLGIGNVTITVNDVTGLGDQGIFARSDQALSDILIQGSSGDIVGATDGIYSRSAGSDISVDNLDSVTGQADDGLDLRSYGGVITVTDIGTIDGDGGNGIRAVSFGGDISIQDVGSVGGVNGANNNGIRALAAGGVGGAINIGDISAIGNVTGITSGIRAVTDGAGSITINSTNGYVTGGTYGVFATNDGTGALSITTADVTGTSFIGILGYSGANSSGLTIDSLAGSVTGGIYGIIGANYGIGAATITTADVTGTAYIGIAGYNSAAGTSLTIDSSAGAGTYGVTGGAVGVGARNYGSGALTITTADAEGTSTYGIYARNEGTDLTIDSLLGSVSGGSQGILALNYGTGGVSVTTANVTGTNDTGIEVYNSAGGTGIAIESLLGSVSGASGISARNNGTGAVSIVTANVTGATFNGIFARNASSATSMTINTLAGSVTGGSNGITVTNLGSGALTITTDDVTGLGDNDEGIRASNDGTDLTINSSAGTVSGGYRGIVAENDGSGALSITTAIVAGTYGGGISAENSAYGTDLTIDSRLGRVSGGTYGIYASNYGNDGATSILTANVTGSGGDGVNLVTGAYTTTADIDTSGGAVIGSNRGIYANHGGSGDLTITVNNVTGESAEGILAFTSQLGADITVQGSSGNVVGATTGILLTTQGADITVTNLDSVTGQAGDGLNLTSNGGNITVTDIGTITGLGGNGIFATSDAGNISIQDIGLVGGITATGGVGIAAYADNGGTISIGTSGTIGTVIGTTYGANGYSAGGAGDVTINVSSYSITGAIGIRAANLGSGATTVTTADVTGTGGDGINASTAGTSVTVDTTAGTVQGLTSGIIARNTGTGATTITTASVTGTTRDGIDAYGGATSTSLTINSLAGSVSGGATGIYASNYGIGATTITTADVTGSSDNGIFASNYIAATDLIIDTTAGSVSGGTGGIYATNYGTGAMAITTSDVSGSSDNGINARNFGTSLSIDSRSGSVSGGLGGIDARNFGSDALDIITAGVTGDTGTGIRAANSGTSLTINSIAGTVSGGTYGISATNAGIGALSITTATVTGAAADGIYAINEAAGTDLTIDSSSGSVSGDLSGILAVNLGSGVLSVTAADVTGAIGNGIYAYGSASGTSLTITSLAGSVNGGAGGISARNLGNGVLSIASANVTGTADDGIYAYGGANGTTLTVDSSAGSVSGGYRGIYANHLGTGELTITVNDVTGLGAEGILAISTQATAPITIQGISGDIVGATDGIYSRSAGADILVDNFGSVTGQGGDGLNLYSGGGAITVTAIDTVTGTGGDGIRTVSDGGDISIQNIGLVGGITGTNGNGIFADASGGVGGVIDIGTTGTLGDINGSENGIYASTDGAGSIAIDTSAGAVSGGSRGILAINQGSGALAISAADVTGDRFAGIFATNSGTNISMAISGTVSGGAQGISAINNGSGYTNIAVAAVTGADGNGINAVNAGTDLIVTATGAISGSIDGISAINNGTGLTSVTADEAVTGTTGNGITIVGGVTGSEVVLTTADAVTGGITGIYADAGIGDLTLDISGDVTGGDNGIVTYTENGTQLVVASGQTITGGSYGIATMTRTGSSTSNDVLTIAGTVNGNIGTFEGDDILTLADASAMNGSALLGSGDDTLNLDGGTYVTLRGGDDTDTLNFNATGGLISGSGSATDDIAEFEIYNFNNGGYSLAGLHTGLIETNFNAGENIWLGALESTSVTIASGADVQLSQGATLSGDLFNSGTLGINATGSDAFTIAGNFTQTAGATLELNVVNAATFDQLTATGTVTLDGTLALTQTAIDSTSLRLIDGGTALNGVFSTVTGLDGAIISQEIVYDAANFDVLLVSTFNSIDDTGLVDPDDISSATDISTSLQNGTFSDDLEAVALNIALISEVPVLERALTETRPEASIAGLEVFRSSQNLFLDRLAAGTAAEPTKSVETAGLGDRLYAPISTQSGEQGGKHVWGNIQYVHHNQDGTLSNPDYTADSFELAAGVSGIELGDITFGFALGYADIDTQEQVPAPDSSKIEVFRAAAIASAPMNKSDRGLNAHVDGMLSFAAGTNAIDMNVVIPTVGYATTQSGEADIHYIGAGVRLTFDGIGDKEWLVKPHLMVAWDNVYQSGMTVGDGTTAFTTEKGNFDRTTFGYGLTMNHQWTDQTRIHAGLSGYHFVGDTQIGFDSTFANNSGATSFNTTGEVIRNQYVVESGIEHSFGEGWSFSADAFAEFGDLQAYGGLLKLTKQF